MAFFKKFDKLFLLLQLCLLNMTKYNFTDSRTETVNGAAEAKHPLEKVLSPGVALLCCTLGPLTVGGSDREKYFGIGENTYLAMRQIVDSHMQYEKERVEA